MIPEEPRPSKSSLAYIPGSKVRRPRLVRLLLLPAAAFVFSAYLPAAIRPLTPESVLEAIQRGEQAKSVDDLCLTFNGVRTPMSRGSVRSYSVTIQTPFCSVAARAYEAKRKAESLLPGSIEILPPDKQLVVIEVKPSASLSSGFGGSKTRFFASVQMVELNRGDEVLPPVKIESQDVTIADAAGKPETYKGGRFFFSASAFGSGAEALKVLVIPEGGAQGNEAVLGLTPADLQKME
jgi:hypothetical protein